MFDWLHRLVARVETKAQAIQHDAQLARAGALSSLDAFYAHMTGGIRYLHDEEAHVQAFWAAEFAKIHGYIAKLESATKAKLGCRWGQGPPGPAGPVRGAVVVT